MVVTPLFSRFDIGSALFEIHGETARGHREEFLESLLDDASLDISGEMCAEKRECTMDGDAPLPYLWARAAS